MNEANLPDSAPDRLRNSSDFPGLTEGNLLEIGLFNRLLRNPEILYEIKVDNYHDAERIHLCKMAQPNAVVNSE